MRLVSEASEGHRVGSEVDPSSARAWVGDPGRGVIARTEVLGSCRSPEMAPALCRFRVSPYRAEKGFP